VSLVTSEDVAGKSYNDLIKMLEDYYKTNHSVVGGERYHCGYSNQQEKEELQTLFSL